MSSSRPTRRRRGPTGRANVVVIRPRNRGRVRVGGSYGRYSGTNRPEEKFFDFNKTATVMGTGGTMLSTSLNLIAQGNDECEMIGRKIVITSMQVRGTIELPQNSNGTFATVKGSDVYRFVLALDKQANGAVATVALVYKDAAINTYNLLQNSSRFSIIKEWKGSLNSGGVAFDSTNALYISAGAKRYFKWYKKCNIPIEMAPNAGARVITDVRSNNLMIIGFSGTGTSTAFFKVRLRYRDV